MADRDVERWVAEARKVPVELVTSTGMPIATCFLEADSIATYLEKYWEPAADGSRPGMSAASAIVPKQVAEETRSLVRACRVLHSDALFAAEATPRQAELLKTANAVLFNLSAALELVLDDGVHEPVDDAFAGARARAASDETTATLVQALQDFAAIAESVKDRLVMLADFKPQWIVDARSVAGELSAAGVPRAGKEASAIIDQRNRMLVLLNDRVLRIRRAARYVFRNHPEVARLSSSAYERTRRAEARRNKLRPEPFNPRTNE